MAKPKRVKTGRTMRTKRIPKGAAINSQAAAPEDQLMRLSFKHHNEDVCECHLVDLASLRKVVATFRNVGQRERSELIGKTSVVDEITVHGSGEYAALFSKLTEDVRLKEHKLTGTARLFYFLDQNDFHVVAITNRHKK